MKHILVLVGLSLAFIPDLSYAQTQKDEGISIATLAIARDSASAQQTAVTGFLVRQSFARNPRYSVLDIEGFLSEDAPSRAREELSRALSMRDKGRQMYDAFELEPAIATLTDSVLAFERGAGALVTMEPYVDALKLLGATLALKADRKAARNTFARALTVDRRASLEGSGFPPTALEIFDEAREQVESAPLASLSIYANPAAAEVYVDGIFRGSAPLTVERLPAGRHLVRVYHAGYRSFGKVAELLPKREETLQAALRPTPQAAQFESMLRRAGPEVGQDNMGQASQELGAWFRVDQLLVTQVTASGDDVTLQVALYDAAGAQRIHAATRTFTFSSPRFRADVEEFILTEFRQAQLGVDADSGSGDQIGSGYAPQRQSKGLHAGYIWGGVSTGVAVVGLVVGVVFTVFAVDINDQLSKLPQVDPSSPTLMAEGQRNVFIAAAGYGVTLIGATGAIILFSIAASEKEDVETILATEGSGGDLPLAWPMSSPEAQEHEDCHE